MLLCLFLRLAVRISSVALSSTAAVHTSHAMQNTTQPAFKSYRSLQLWSVPNGEQRSSPSKWLPSKALFLAARAACILLWRYQCNQTTIWPYVKQAIAAFNPYPTRPPPTTAAMAVCMASSPRSPQPRLTFFACCCCDRLPRGRSICRSAQQFRRPARQGQSLFGRLRIRLCGCDGCQGFGPTISWMPEP